MTDDEIPPPPEPIDGIFIDVARAQLIPPSWIIEDLIPPGLLFLAGPPKSKKSTITAAAAALVAEYQCHALPENLSRVRQTGPVLWLSAEALAGEIHHMMEHGLGIPPMEPREAILIAECPWDFRLDDPNAIGTLLRWLEARDPRLVIIDPLRDFHSLEEKDSGGMNRLLRPIRQWAVKHDSAVIIVHHTTKKNGDDKDPIYRAADMRGTGALFGIADAVLMLTPKGDPAEGRIFIEATFKRAAGWEKEITLAAYGANETASEPLQDIDAQVGRALANDSTDVAAIAKRLHVGVPTVLNAIARIQGNKQQGSEEVKKGKSSWQTTRTK